MKNLTAGDSPQTDPCKDLLNRKDTVAAISDMIAKSDTDNGLVVSIIGPWGSGKTTVLSFIEQFSYQLGRRGGTPVGMSARWSRSGHTIH